MLPIRTILHPTDFSRLAGYAFHLARALARDYGARLTVLHVAEETPKVYEVLPSEAERAAEKRQEKEELAEKLRQFVNDADAGLPIEQRLEEECGDPAQGILRVARGMRPDLIVMGTHGRTWLRQTHLGSVAEQVLRNAPCPVVVVKAPLRDTLPPDSEVLPEGVELGEPL